jgi:predicted metal-dependent enzyme (double-stranded beta helix superfamily)
MAVVTAQVRDGTVVEERVDVRKGEPESPLTRAETQAKLAGLLAVARRKDVRFGGLHRLPTPDPRSAAPSAAKETPMCDDFHNHHLVPLDADEWTTDSPVIRGFVGAVRERIAAGDAPQEACAAVEPLFAELLADRTWLPAEYQHDAPASGMGGGIGQWLLFRAADRSLCLFSLVVPAGAMTPVHDHLAWGLIGLYAGNQDEEIYRPGGGHLDLIRRRALEPGDYYTLLPPRNDVHRVRTTSDVTSVSIHMLANDTGCVLRHTFDESTGETKPFRSGYVNAACESDSERDACA